MGELDMQDKILGKYEIMKEENPSLKIGHYNDCDYRIEIVPKTPQVGQYSEIAKSINSVSHKNISNLRIEEDDSHFYFVDKDFGEEYSSLKADWFGKNYVSLIRCYLQIIDAVDYIHQKGFYHGNINPKNIIVDRNDNAYLLDFGRCYIYAILKNEPNKQFYAPEQIYQNESRKESDVYSLGLCMLKLLVDSCFSNFSFEQIYSDPTSLEQIFEYITEEKEKASLDKINSDLFLLIRKKMLKGLPADRADLIEIRKELNDLLRQILPCKTFGIQISDKVLEKWRQNHGCYRYEEKSNIQKRIDGYKAYWEFGKDKSDRDEIKIAIGNLVFCCSGKPQEFFFCFQIIEDPHTIERQLRFGFPTDDKFKIAGQNEVPRDCDDASQAILDLKKLYEQKEFEDNLHETDKTSIISEEKLLEAEKKTIDEKKNTRKVILREIDRGKDTIKLEFISEKDDDENTELNIEEKDSKNLGKKDFKIGQAVILQVSKDSSGGLEGEVSASEAGKMVTVRLKKYEVMQNELKRPKNKTPVRTESEDSDDKSPRVALKENEEYYLSYDYQVEEIIWSKRNRALEELQNGNTQIPNLLRKINRPQEFIKNDLIDVEQFYNEELDENQKEAVIKSLSLNTDCEVLALQGPPGTGKTTTITEIVIQILKTRPHERILVASQSNQAVDNVLEKICKIEDKILRIGNDPKKMSSIARNYTPEKVLNKIIKENIRRIDENPAVNKNPEIQAQMRNLQENFREKLQHITSKMGNSENSTEKNKDGDLATLFTRNIRLIFGTLLGISSWKNFREMYFDTIIVDEAGRATLSELLVPCIKAKKLILVGDHKQLAPVIDDDVLEKIDDKNEAKTSFFQRLFERIESADRENLLHTLAYNYRAERRICDLYSNAFYEGKLKTTDVVNAKKSHSLSFASSVVWYDTGKLQNKEDKQEGTGKINPCNVTIIKRVLSQLKDEMIQKNITYDIGIITPYKAQMEFLHKKLAIKKDFADYKIDIGTVDSFQGSDRDIIIYDCVRSSKLKQKAKIDFIAEEKRLNVSLSRAKLLLIIVGDMDFLHQAQVSDKNNPFRSIIEYIMQNKDAYEIIEEKPNGEK